MDTTVKLKLGFAALMIASGIGVAMYPVISNAVAQRHASSVIESYNDTVQTMDTEKIDAAKEAARRYNEQLGNAIDRDAAGEAADTGTSYVDMLDVGESLGYITIPKIDVNLPIYEGTSDDVLSSVSSSPSTISISTSGSLSSVSALAGSSAVVSAAAPSFFAAA